MPAKGTEAVKPGVNDDEPPKGSGSFIGDDSYHRLCRFTEPESGSTITTYDAANNVQTAASGLSIAGTGCGAIPAGSQTTYMWYPTNKVHTVLPPAGTQSTSYMYDANGNLTSAASGISVWNGHYNFRNQLTSETSNLNNGQFNWVLGYAHDAYGHLSTVTYPTGEVVSYALNPRGFDAAAGRYAGTIAYTADGSMASEKFGNGINGYLNQNARLLPGSLIYGKGGVAKFQESYTYDANANLKTVADQIKGQNNQTWGYDALNRLTSASAPNAWGNQTYAYDPLNRLRQYLSGGYTLPSTSMPTAACPA